ncbi:hypothetical protein [Psychroflexus planctonicus]|uniref:Uncharacterized protein n=1 Tax=Psychroflexus planctonicus TaxID=1526575 RepID=A0ABQ1SFC1_9FLAO|nr:hypothetical protein [Psychroflexus planctonicus]GGE28820.1 hypothetical protein GCM10010832_06810 [Psychroflexus planctonicus]
MDGLDILKKDWKKQEEHLPKFEAKEIYAMLKKKSSSIVKWIFIVSILEFVFWIGLEVFTSVQGYNDIIVDMDIDVLYNTIMIINYAVILGFIAIFFYNYQQIRITDNAKRLMKKILITRKTVKCYVWFNIIYFAITFMLMNFLVIQNMEEFQNVNIWIFMAIMFGIMLIFIGLIWLFYRLVYGFLTRKLYKNYKQLQTLDL